MPILPELRQYGVEEELADLRKLLHGLAYAPPDRLPELQAQLRKMIETTHVKVRGSHAY